MKKIFFFIICLFNINIVYADSIPEFIPIFDKCQFISGNEANIPIKIISTDEGQLTTLIDKYKIGTIYNNGNISTTNQNIIIDTLKDNNQNSNVYLTIKDNLTIHKGEEITSFIISFIPFTTFKAHIGIKTLN